MASKFKEKNEKNEKFIVSAVHKACAIIGTLNTNINRLEVLPWGNQCFKQIFD